MAAVVVTHRRPAALAATLRALGRQQPTPAVVIVVDNGGDGAARRLAADLGEASSPPIEVVEAPTNDGYAAGLALGVDHLRAQHPACDAVLFSDDDTVLRQGALQLLVDALTPDVGMVTSGPGHDGWTGIRWRSTREPIVGLVDQALVRLAALDDVPLRRDLFMMFEDVDLSRRLRRSGWQLRAVEVPVERSHLGAGAVGPPWRAHYQTRNELLLALEGRHPRDLVAAAARLVKHLVAATATGRGAVVRARLLGVAAALRGRTGRDDRWLPSGATVPAVPAWSRDEGDGRSVAVVVPMRDEAEVVRRQVSALRASADAAAGWQVRLVFCDNGSSDGSADVVADAAAGDSRVSVLDAAAARGAPGARNLGIIRTPADVYLFTDADDVVEVGWLAAHLAAFDGGATATAGAWRVEARGGAGGDLLQLWGRAYPLGANLGVTRSVLEAVGGFDEAAHGVEDVELGWRVEDAGHSWTVVPDAVIERSIPSGSLERFRKHLGYGRGQRWLVRSGRLPITQRTLVAQTLRRALWLLRTAPDLLRPGRRADWCGGVGRLVGLVRG